MATHHDPRTPEPPPLPAWATRRAEPALSPPPRREPVPPSTVECPRCAYDLTPMLPTPGPARDATATCSECGLTFTWNGLFAALRQLLPHFIEHSKGFAATLIAIPWTFAWLVLPHRFWSRVTIERKVRLSRAWLWVLVIVPTLRLSETAVILLAQTWHIVIFAYGAPSAYEVSKMVLDAFLIRTKNSWYHEPPLAQAALLLSLLSAVMLAILPQTRRQAKVRTALVVRCWLYSNALVAILYLWNAACVIHAALVPDGYMRGLGYSPYQRIEEAIEQAADLRADAFPLFLAAMAAWQLWYWYSALRSLRIKHAPMVTLSMVAAAALATVLVLLLEGEFPIESLI